MHARSRAWCESIGIELPIIQAPMAGVQDSALAISVCRAGGLGSLPAAMLDPERLGAALARIVENTDRPYNVNFFCHQPPAPDPEREANWRRVLAPYYAQYGIAPEAGGGPTRKPFDAELAALIEPFRPPVVSFHFGLPAPEVLERARRWNPRVLASATTVEEAVWLEQRGVDAVIAQGLEAGGHRGSFLSPELSLQMGTLALVPQIVEAVSVPVIAAGGIADPAGVNAALALGAVAVQLGTVYLLCPEATTSATHRGALVGPQARHTAITNLFSGRPARGIVNRVMRELGPIHGEAPAFPNAAAPMAPLRAAAEAQGRGDFSPLWAGQNVAGCREIGAAELTRWLATGLEEDDESTWEDHGSG